MARPYSPFRPLRRITLERRRIQDDNPPARVDGLTSAVVIDQLATGGTAPSYSGELFDGDGVNLNRLRYALYCADSALSRVSTSPMVRRKFDFPSKPS